MGCDIHMYAERRSPDGKWESCDSWVQGEDFFEVPYKDAIYTGRNYQLFSILANVRNGLGIIPFSEPRGIPKDMSEEVEREYLSWKSDVHSSSWFTVKELMGFDWTRVLEEEGLATLSEYQRIERDRVYKEDYEIEELGALSFQADSHKPEISEDEAKVVLELFGDDLVPKDDTDVLVRVVCRIPYFRFAEEFLSRSMPLLWKLGDPENVRVVFWFDN